MSILGSIDKFRMSLPGWTARKRDVVFDGGLGWDDWFETKLAAQGTVFVVGGAASACLRNVQDVEREFPGFMKAYDLLVSMGCDTQMLTLVMKHLITHKSKYSLDRRIEILSVKNKVVTALALDITGDNLVAYLESGSTLSHTDTVLPDNIHSL